MSYTRLSRRPLLFKSFTGLELTEFDIISKEIESKYHEHERMRLSNRKRNRDVGAGRPFKLKLYQGYRPDWFKNKKQMIDVVENLSLTGRQEPIYFVALL